VFHSTLFDFMYLIVLPRHIAEDPLRLSKASSSSASAATSPIHVSVSTWDIRATCLLLLHRPLGGSWAMAAADDPSSRCSLTLHPPPPPPSDQYPLPCIQLSPLPTRFYLLSSPPPEQTEHSSHSSQTQAMNYEVEVSVMQRRDVAFDVSAHHTRSCLVRTRCV
jgi:hypothetical protein